MSERRQGVNVHLILVGAQLCFGSLAVAGRLALPRVPADALVMTRLVGGAIAFGLIAKLRGTLKIARADLLPLAGCALLGVVLNMEFFIHGLQRSTATNATVLGSTIPVFTALFALALGREAFRWLRFAGIALALSGAMVLIGIENVSTDNRYLAGNVMVIINAASYGLYLVVVRKWAQRYDAIALTAYLFFIGMLVVAPLGVPAWAELAPRLEARDVGLLAFIVAVPTLGSYFLTQLALKRAESSLVASYIYLQPVVATIGAMIFLGETLHGRTIVAAVLIFAGVFVSTRALMTAKPPPLSEASPHGRTPA